MDQIERALSDYLPKRPLKEVHEEFARLRDSANRALGPVAGMPLEDTQLLRRQIARRCIYGVDRNSIAVDLARLALWIHTFVPGLPLSFLDHSLLWGNALVGIGTLDEADRWMEEVAGSLLRIIARNWRPPRSRCDAGWPQRCHRLEIDEARIAFSEARGCRSPSGCAV